MVVTVMEPECLGLHPSLLLLRLLETLNSLCFSFLIYRKERMTGSTSKVVKTKCINKHKVL